MNIKGIIQNFGYLLEEGGEVFPIAKDGIKTPLIFDQLIESGYELISTDPLLFRKDGEVLDKLPEYTKGEYIKDDAMEQYLLDSAVDTYSEKELSLRIAEDIKYAEFKFLEPIDYKINNREELVAFLEATKDNYAAALVNVLPLNAIVNPDALLTPEEYVAEENSHIRTMIEKRYKLTVKQFAALLGFLSNYGVTEYSSPDEIIQAYLSWGIPGINAKVYDREVVQSQYTIYSKYLGRQNSVLANSVAVMAYLDTAGEIHLPDNYPKGTRFKCEYDEVSREKIRSSISRKGYNYIYPLRVDIPTPETQYILSLGDKWQLQYSSDMMMLSYLPYSQNHIIGGLSVVSPLDASTIIDKKYWNLLNSTTTAKLLRELKYSALAEIIAEQTQVKSDVSSYKVCQALSLDRVAAVRMILTGEEDNAYRLLCEINDVDFEDRDKMPLMNTPTIEAGGYLDRYFSGMEEPGTKPYEVCTEMVSDTVNGVRNIGDTYKGASSDAQFAKSTYINAVKAAHQFLGMSFEEIENVIKNFQWGDSRMGVITFSGNGRSLSLEVYKRDRKLSGFKSDLFAKVKEAANIGNIFCYITDVYTEVMANPDNPKPVAVGLLQYYSDSKVDAGYRWIENELKKRASSVLFEDEAIAIVDDLIISIPRLIYQAYFKGTIKFPQPLRQSGLPDEIEVPANILGYIRSCVTAHVESIALLQQAIVSKYSGKVIRSLTNARIIDEYVVPAKGVTIREVPVLPMWVGSRMLTDERCKRAVEQRMFIPKFEEGVSDYYSQLTIDKKAMDSPLSLRSYMRFILDHVKKQAGMARYLLPKTMYEMQYPNAYVSDDDSLTDDVAEYINQAPTFNFHDVNRITYDIVMRRNPHFSDPSKPVIGDDLQLLAKKEITSKVYNLDREDVLKANSLSELGILDLFEEGIAKAVQVTNTSVVFDNGEVFSFGALPELDRTKYAVTSRFNKLYVHGYTGELYRVVL